MAAGNVSVMATPLEPDDPASLGGYSLSGRLGEGGQGVVYLARSPAGEQVAVKLLSAGDKETRARLARELQALESIASFCTARVLDVSTQGPRPYVVSEYVDGPSLADRVRERGPLHGGDLERLAVGTATALAAIHAAGVVHRDFKPANVLLGPDGPRVVDFGIARAEGAATLSSGLIGTPAYLAPEQIGGSPASPASDVFAWASSMIFAATGTSPFGADTVPAVLHRVLHAEPDLSPLPPRLRGLIASCLAKDPAGRPSARQLMMSLVGPQVPPPGGPYESPPQGRRGPGIPLPPPRHGPPSGEGLDTGPPYPARDTRGTRRARSRGLLVGGVAGVVVLAAAVATALYLNGASDPGTVVGDRTTSAGPPASPSAATSPSAAASPSEAQSPPSEAESPPPSAESPEPTGTPGPSDPGQGEDLEIPAAFAGTWTGHTDSTNPMDSDGADNTVVLKAGSSTAAWAEKNPPSTCRGTIKLTKVEEAQLTFSLGANDGGCIAGTIWLAKKGDTLTYTWRDTPGFDIVTQTGTLRRSGS
ncbi:protein kinase [Nonomuraea phyllanthi]|uniref:Protein kinase n=2 Tax=Nonomuraea phyllanthi TaxID=2219224 RepID=A0A5C4VTI9_9ACTN|nr:protein kinase [Nonomuraea phyllanthi]